MGRVKEQLLNEHPNLDLDTTDFAYQFELWKKSKEYVNLVNDELIDTQLMYSKSDIKEAVCYAFEGVVVSQTEIGSDIYSKLIYGKIKEYLNK
jgi:hypothetical protein